MLCAGIYTGVAFVFSLLVGKVFSADHSHRNISLFGFGDGWNRPIQLQIESNTVSLISFGEDGKRGGEGEAGDITCRFSAQQPECTWSPELVEWSERVMPQRSRE